MAAMTHAAPNRSVISAALAVLVWVLLGGLAHAQAPTGATIDLIAPEAGAVGQEMTVAARLTDRSGSPIAGAEILIQASLEFFNTAGDVELGRGTTDQRGAAIISFVPLTEGDTEILAVFDGDAAYGAAFASATVPVAAGPQQYVDEAGIKVPGINVSLLIAILGTVWGTYFVVMFRVFLIARDDSPAVESGGDL
jgi:hypothetical protein